MSDSNSFTFTGRLRSFSHAAVGLRLMLCSQHNAWVHALATIIVVGLSLLLGINRIEWSLIIVAIILVWTSEALNTAFELLCDVASPEFHPIVKNAKDVAAGAVLVCAFGSVIIGLLIFIPHIFSH